jgi:pantoate--beta-alanine ligase
MSSTESLIPQKKLSPIKIFTRSKHVLSWRSKLKNETLGFVPTMGNLHEGHLSLVKKAFRDNSVVVISIFVNPLQFGPKEDFHSYPRTLKLDLNKLEILFYDLKFSYFKNKKLIIFAPQTHSEIYPQDFSSSISVGPLSQLYCGATRPHHFDGVATVIYQLHKIISPKKIYLGEKDFQQTLIIKKLVHDLRLNSLVITVPTVRDQSGLALSSRNQYLTKEEKIQSLKLRETLRKIQGMIENTINTNWKSKMKSISTFRSKVEKDSSWDYIGICDAQNLGPILESTKKIVVLGALYMGKTRLIDNVVFKNPYTKKR